MSIGSRRFSLVLSFVAVAGAALAAACSDDPADAGSASTPSSPSAPAASTDAGASDATAAADDSGRSSFTPPPTCTSFTYSEWSICRYDSTQVRSVVSTVPPDCYGGGPVLKQSCTFVVPTDGPGLYDAYCSGCHGNAKKGASASSIKSAIASNRGGMSVLSSLTDDQINLIAAAK